MAILVIGGNGFLGRKLITLLLRDDMVSSVISMDLTTPKATFMSSIERYGDKFHFVRGNVSQFEDILNAIKLFSVQKGT